MSNVIEPGDIARFRPRTARQFLIFHIAFRLDDLRNLARYLNTGLAASRDTLISAARRAEEATLRDGSHAASNFWALLELSGEEGT